MYDFFKIADVDYYYEMMKDDFPYEERRGYYAQQRALLDDRFRWLRIESSAFGDEVGYVSYWEYEDFIFVEHFAIAKEKRNLGYGKSVLPEFLEKVAQGKRVILEVEHPTDEVKIRRVEFYKARGFYLNDYEYQQPSYHGEESLPLLLMSYPSALTQVDYDKFVTLTKSSAYSVTD